MAEQERALTQGWSVERTTDAAGGVLRRVLELAIDGYAKVPGARTTAGKHLARTGEVDAAIEALIGQHIALAGAQGFLTNLGGIITLPISIPSNLTGLAVMQTRMIAGIAHLRGYDLSQSQVRTALLMCLLGEDGLARADESTPRRPLVVATAPVFDPKLDRLVASAVITHFTTRVTGKQAALLVTKRIPVIGGGVGAAVDSYGTRQAGQFAKKELVARRALRG
ncbi:EcsC family protein [Naumannella halotolerans]|uniref:EcsC family protein n=1 Tax=Naumannella halotolerans TaxID=993414 RepID=A0A4R7IWY4_9ACTN|nr:EcsC family protein [Naumannella halotolerans]TDT29114.1 EcsC family protein [Naumannella halotolerans]